MTDLAHRAYSDLIRGISTHRYGDGIRGFLKGYRVSLSSLSCHMVIATEGKLKELLERQLEDLDIAVVLIDGVHVGGGTVVIALSIDTQGVKHILGLWQGSTETKSVATHLVTELIDRGLDPERPMLKDC